MKNNIFYHTLLNCSKNENFFRTKFVGKIKTHFLIFNNDFSFEKQTIYEIMQKNILQPDRPQMTIWRMRIACSIQTHTQNM